MISSLQPCGIQEIAEKDSQNSGDCYFNAHCLGGHVQKTKSHRCDAGWSRSFCYKASEIIARYPMLDGLEIYLNDFFFFLTEKKCSFEFGQLRALAYPITMCNMCLGGLFTWDHSPHRLPQRSEKKRGKSFFFFLFFLFWELFVKMLFSVKTFKVFSFSFNKAWNCSEVPFEKREIDWSRWGFFIFIWGFFFIDEWEWTENQSIMKQTFHWLLHVV